MPRYRAINIDDVKLGQTLRVTEHYPTGTTSTTEGRLATLSRDSWVEKRPSGGWTTHYARTATFAGLPYEKPSLERLVALDHVTLELVLPDLPEVPGAVISTETGRLAVYRYDGEEGESGWWYVDFARPVGDEHLITADIVFTPEV